MIGRFSVLARAVLLGVTATGAIWAGRAPRDRAPEGPASLEHAAPDPERGDPAGGLVTLVGQNPFREDRRPTSPRYLPFDPDSVLEADQTPAPPTPRPEWTLTGVLWGGQPLALFDGIPPELSSGILAQGDSIGPIHVERIAPDTVYLRGIGASWAFTIETPWKTARES